MVAMTKCRDWLQWGRGFEAAETRKKPKRELSDAELQWGRGFEAAETMRVSRISSGTMPLQWGRGFEAAETNAVVRCFTACRSASMGPRL